MQDKVNAETGLLRSICENPYDDDLRWIYADLLDDMERDKRAEFIRIQLELAKKPNCLDIYPHAIHTLYPSCQGCDRVIELYPRMLKLFEYLQFNEFQTDNWAAISDLREHLNKPINSTLEVRRGFVWLAANKLNRLLDDLPVLLLQHPIEQVIVTDRAPQYYPERDIWKSHWTWWLAKSDSNRMDLIPYDIWQLLDNADDIFYAGVDTAASTTKETKNYFTLDKANEELNKAVLKYCLSKAGITREANENITDGNNTGTKADS